MLFPPLIERELRVALRKRQVVKYRLWAAVAAVGVSALFMLLGLAGDKSAWRTLNQFLFLGGMAFGVIQPAQACIGLFSEERRSQTLELLYLTGMTSVELFVGKLLGGLLASSSELLAIMPCLALPFLGGGITFQMFSATVTSLPVLLLFSVSAAVLASVLCAEDGLAMLVGGAVVVAVSAATPVPYALGKALTGYAPYSANWLWLSPGYGAWLVGEHFGTGKVSEFWPTAAFTLVWSLLFLSVAAVVLARSWRTGYGRIAGNRRGLWERLVRGGSAWRAGLRSRVLESNAFQWLVQMDRRMVVAAWMGMGGVGLLWIGGWLAWPQQWPSTFSFFITAMLLIIMVDNLELYAAARRLGDSRRDGMLELLLTTPLTPEQIVDGQFASLRAQFGPVRITLFGLCVAMAIGGFYTRTWNPMAIISYILIWSLFLLWCLPARRRGAAKAMWVAVITGRPTYGLIRAHGSPWRWMWLFFNLKNLVSSLGNSAVRFPSGSPDEFGFVAIVFIVVVIVALVNRHWPFEVRENLIREMRAIAQTPVPAADDPRFKQWKDVRQPFPAE